MSQPITVEPPLYYRHSGSAPMASTTLAAIGSWVAVTILGIAYGWADLNIKLFDIISALICLGFALAMGFGVAYILHLAKVRSIPVAVVVSVSAALLGLYMSWVSWEHALLAKGDAAPPMWEMFRRPDLIWAFAREINPEGTFSLRKSPVTGIFLWIIWIVEAGIFLGCVTLIPLSSLRDSTYCETCDRWCPDAKVLMRTQHANEADLKQELEQKNFLYVEGLPPADTETPLHLQFDLCTCPTCQDLSVLSVTRVAVGQDSKGNRQETRKKVIDRLHVTADEAAELQSLAAPKPIAPVPPPADATGPDTPSA